MDRKQTNIKSDLNTSNILQQHQQTASKPIEHTHTLTSHSLITCHADIGVPTMRAPPHPPLPTRHLEEQWQRCQSGLCAMRGQTTGLWLRLRLDSVSERELIPFSYPSSHHTFTTEAYIHSPRPTGKHACTHTKSVSTFSRIRRLDGCHAHPGGASPAQGSTRA